jgi:hypothetical protein
MLPQMGPPETSVWEYPQKDESWSTEFTEFAEDIRIGRRPNPSLVDASAALSLIERVASAKR